MKRTLVCSSHSSKQRCSKDAHDALSSISSNYLHISFDYFSFIMFLLKDSVQVLRLSSINLNRVELTMALLQDEAHIINMCNLMYVCPYIVV